MHLHGTVAHKRAMARSCGSSGQGKDNDIVRHQIVDVVDGCPHRRCPSLSITCRWTCFYRHPLYLTRSLGEQLLQGGCYAFGAMHALEEP